MSWQTTANDRLSDYKENAMKKMSATTSRSGGNDVEARARKEKNTEEDGKVESLLLKNMAPPPNEDDDENDADANIVDRCCRVMRGESCKKFGLCWLLLLFSFSLSPLL